jgi:hypothetical protein
MDRLKEQELFAGLARGTPRLVDWLKSRLDREVLVLIDAPDTDRLKQAQGAAKAYREMLKLMGHDQ